MFIDGVYRSRSGIGLNELGEVERIEVLRGPQGTLFGRNASAGLIHVITRRPEFEFGGYAELTYGNYDYIRGAGAHHRADRRACSPSGSTRVYARRDGFYDVVNPTGGTESDVNDRDRFFVRGQLLFEPNDALSIRLIGDYSTRDESCCGAVYLGPRDQPARSATPTTRRSPLRVGGATSPTATASSTCCATSASRSPRSAIPTAANIYVSPGRTYRGRDRGLGRFAARSTGISAARP